jgi:hypothetical protein
MSTEENKHLSELDAEDDAIFAFLLEAFEKNHPSDEEDSTEEDTTSSEVESEDTTSSEVEPEPTNHFSPQTNEDYYADERHQEKYDNS